VREWEAEVTPIVSRVVGLSAKYLYSDFAKARLVLETICEDAPCLFEHSSHTSLVVAKNDIKLAHCDGDYTFSVGSTATMADDGEGLCDGREFVFPTLGFACKLEENTVFVFNPSVPHCIAEAYNLRGKNARSISVGAYGSEAVADRIKGGTQRL